MYEQIDKPKENKKRALGNSVVQKKNISKQGLGFVDNRPKSATELTCRDTTNPVSKARLVKQLMQEANTGTRQEGQPETHQAVAALTTEQVKKISKDMKSADEWGMWLTSVLGFATIVAGTIIPYHTPAMPFLIVLIPGLLVIATLVAKLVLANNNLKRNMKLKPGVKEAELKRDASSPMYANATAIMASFFMFAAGLVGTDSVAAIKELQYIISVFGVIVGIVALGAMHVNEKHDISVRSDERIADNNSI